MTALAVLGTLGTLAYLGMYLAEARAHNRTKRKLVDVTTAANIWEWLATKDESEVRDERFN